MSHPWQHPRSLSILVRVLGLFAIFFIASSPEAAFASGCNGECPNVAGQQCIDSEYCEDWNGEDCSYEEFVSSACRSCGYQWECSGWECSSATDGVWVECRINGGGSS